MVIYFIKFLIILIVAIILTGLYAKFGYSPLPEPRHPLEQRKKNATKWMIALIVTGLIFYAFLSFFLSLTWLGGDDFLFANRDALKDQVIMAIGKYCRGVSRVGESIAALIGISENRWQHFVLTPIFITLLPLSLYRLVRVKRDTIFCAKGITFYVLILSLLLAQLPDIGWRNYKCFAAAVNYLWPLVALALLLSYYRSDESFSKKHLLGSTVALFLMGVYVGWSVECISCLLTPALLITCIIKIKQKRCYVPQFAGFVGAIFGAFFIFASPALYRRAAWASRDCAFNVSEMSFNEAFELACSITPQNVHQLGAAAIPAYLGEFPFILRPLFFPELMASYLPFCAIPLIACLLFMILTSISGRKKNKRTYLIAFSGLGISVLCATTYLVKCIPYNMSFLPAAFFIIATAGYLMLRIPLKFSLIVSIPAFAYMLYFLIPPMCELYKFTPERDAQMQLIHQQISQGQKDIVLPYPLSSKPVDSLFIIRSGIYNESPGVYPNALASSYFRINSIRTLPRKIEKKKGPNE